MKSFRAFLVEARKEASIYVISGGPGVGKTTVINELAKRFEVLPETARLIGTDDPRFQAVTRDACAFQHAILGKHKEQVASLGPDQLAFSDRGAGDSLAYSRLYCPGLAWRVAEYASDFHYAGIFILDPLPTYAQDAFRRETVAEQAKIHNAIIGAYLDLNYKPIFVPPVGVEARTQFIVGNVGGLDRDGMTS